MPADAVAPKRERGRLRVQAITDAALVLFAERGFDGTTMTEIAQASGTAIGSLYRFFPTKESLADSLLRQYADALSAKLEALAAEAPGLDNTALADRLFSLRAESPVQQAALEILADARRDGPYDRAVLRQNFSDGLARVLRAADPTLRGPALVSATDVLRQLFKGARALEEQARGHVEASLDQWRWLTCAHLDRVLTRSSDPF